jgi:hypothetical protein
MNLGKSSSIMRPLLPSCHLKMAKVAGLRPNSGPSGYAGLKNMKAAMPEDLMALPYGHREVEDPTPAGVPWSPPYSSVASPNVGARSPMFVPTWEPPSRARGPVPASGTAWTVT